MKTDKFEQWAIIDLFGHQRLAGIVSEATIGGCAFVRVDVPESEGEPGFTRFFGNGAIYSISPVEENIARLFAKQYRARPVQAYDLPRIEHRPAEEDGEGMGWADPDSEMEDP